LMAILYPLFAGFAINAVVKGDVLHAPSYAVVVFVMWTIGMLRRRVDTRVFTKIYAEMVGYGETCDANHITAPIETGEGATKAMRIALKDANLSLDDVTYINAHGTSTPTNDVVETRAIKALFGDKAKDLYISSTKGATGHGLGAAGGIEGVIIAKAIADGVIPPTINLHETEEECDLNYVPNQAIKTDVKVAMSNSLGFGGHNSVIVMKKFEK